MQNVHDFTSTDKTYTPRANAKMFFADYDGFNGVISITEDHQVIFKTPGTAWYPLVNMNAVVVLGEVSIAMQQVVLDDLAGGLTAIACSRPN